MTDKLKQIGRLAMRVEGDWWVAYYALPDTMKDAIELGRIRMTIVANWQAKELFMSICRDAVTDIIKDVTGQTPAAWETVPGPEHERSGRA